MVYMALLHTHTFTVHLFSRVGGHIFTIYSSPASFYTVCSPCDYTDTSNVHFFIYAQCKFFLLIQTHTHTQSG